MRKYDRVIDFMLNHKSINYSDFYYTKNNIEDPDFRKNHNNLLLSIADAKKKGARISTSDQEGEFLHIFVNNSKKITNKARLYLSPTRKNLLPLVVEIINKSLNKGQRTYIKYSQRPERLDQLLFYLEDEKDAVSKLGILNEIRESKPELFKNMSQAPNWIYETPVPDVFLTPNAFLKDRLGRETSYGYLFQYALNDTKDILEYIYGIGETQSLALFKSDSLFYNRFERVFEEMLRRYGIFLHRDKQGSLVNDMAQGNKDGTPISMFSYDKKNRVLKETRGFNQPDQKVWTFGQNFAEKQAFINYIMPPQRTNANEQR